MKNVLKKVLAALNVVCVIFVIIAFLMVIPMLFHIKPYIILSGSMEPTIRTGSLVYVNERADVSELKVGDVVTFNVGENVVTHRIYDVQEDAFVTKGDANDTPDFNPVNISDVKGEVQFSIPYAGYIVSWFNTMTGRIVALWIIAILLFSLFF